MTPDPLTVADGSRRAAMIKAWPSGFTNRCAEATAPTASELTI
jgi:hypothetical protein